MGVLHQSTLSHRSRAQWTVRCQELYAPVTPLRASCCDDSACSRWAWCLLHVNRELFLLLLVWQACNVTGIAMNTGHSIIMQVACAPAGAERSPFAAKDIACNCCAMPSNSVCSRQHDTAEYDKLCAPVGAPGSPLAKDSACSCWATPPDPVRCTGFAGRYPGCCSCCCWLAWMAGCCVRPGSCCCCCCCW